MAEEDNTDTLPEPAGQLERDISALRALVDQLVADVQDLRGKDTAPAQHDSLSDRVKTLHTYAWNYFDFHAKQRIQIFNFFILSAGVWAGAIGWLLRSDIGAQYVPIPLFVGAIMCLGFLALDRRNTQLVEIGEDILRYIEEKYLVKGIDHIKDQDKNLRRPGLLRRENYSEQPRRKKIQDAGFLGRIFYYATYNRIKHKMAIRILESVSFLAFLVAADITLVYGLVACLPEIWKFGIPAVSSVLLLGVWYFILTSHGIPDERAVREDGSPAEP